METTKKEIAEAAKLLFGRIPKELQDGFLLTGGAAAFLYGSERPFSHDMDFMVPKEDMEKLHRALNLDFTVHTNKAVFHSLKAVFDEGGQSYDLIARSIIELEDAGVSCVFELTPEIRSRKVRVALKGMTLYLLPKEVLVLIKLLAGRGQEAGKYDLYDARVILEKNTDFDFEFFRKLISECPQFSEKVRDILLAHAGKVGNAKLLEVLLSLQQSE